MNHYGAQMMRHWQEERSQELEQLEDPETFFAELGVEIAQQVETQARSLSGEAPSQEGYLARLQRLNTARMQAESEVVRKYLLQEPEPTE
ncbi:hypothetical protein [Streptomyces sp. NBC_00470]|uniref:hypothetical protein n=1 Tax=Streptomyces sp. NBC_00470 TaxID=2975753 RepID=UPI002F91AE71